jgi:hypothetical protein
MEQLRICALNPQLLPSRRRVRSLEDLLAQNAQSASQCACAVCPARSPDCTYLRKRVDGRLR